MKSQDNLFLPYRLRDLWYEAQKNQRNMQKKKTKTGLPGWEDMAI